MTTQHKKKQRLGILVCGHSHEQVVKAHGKYEDVFPELLGVDTYDYQVYHVVDNQFPTSINEADAWLLTGSIHGVYEDFEWIAPLETLVREIYAEKLPMVGICFGHQLMAQALGGKVEKFSGGWVTGTQHYEFSAESGFAMDDKEAVVINAWHQDQVIEKPADAKIIGSSKTCKIAALEYSPNTVSLQPHPEFDNDYLSTLLEYRGGNLPDPIRQAAIDGNGQNLTSPRIAEWLNERLMRNA